VHEKIDFRQAKEQNEVISDLMLLSSTINKKHYTALVPHIDKALSKFTTKVDSDCDELLKQAAAMIEKYKFGSA
jgi:hypothetical protein